MNATRAFPLGPGALFLVLVAALCTVELAILAHPRFLTRPDVLASAVTLDLILGVPALGYLCLVRTRRVGAWALVPLFLMGVLLARWWIPGPRRGLLYSLEWLLVALELGLIAFLALRARRVWRRYRREKENFPYPLDALRIAVDRTLGSRLAAELLVTEMAVLHFALSGWWKRPPEGSSDQPLFPCYRRNGYPALLGALLLVCAVEIAVVHLLLGLWSGWAAWVATGLGIYSVVWLLGDFHAMRLQPTLVGESGLHLRVGLRWRTHVAWAEVKALHPSSWAPPESGVKLTPIGAPDFWLELRAPTTAQGLFGIQKRVRFLGVGVEDPKALESLIRRRAGGVSRDPL